MARILASRSSDREGMKMNFLAVCPECQRTFDLTDPEDASEWSYGHDCDVTPLNTPTEGESK